MLSLHLLLATSILAAVLTVIGFGIEKDLPWASWGVAFLIAPQAVFPMMRVWEIWKRIDPGQAIGKTCKFFAVGHFAAVGAFLISVIVGETWWSALGIAWAVAFGFLWLRAGRRGSTETAVG